MEFDAVLDTGFTGFIAMPLISALPLGLMLYGTTSVELADGSQDMKLTAKGMAVVSGEKKMGVVILEPNANDVLIGMAFLRIFKRALFVTQDFVVLINEDRRPDPDVPEPTTKTNQDSATLTQKQIPSDPPVDSN